MKFLFSFLGSFLLCFCLFSTVTAATFPVLGDSARISLLTESPASDFYTAWGHSALRINDSVNHSDLVFNFGTFDFNDQYFYLKFIKGTLRYTESIYNYSDYLAGAYQDPHRIVEQVLNLSPAQKQKISDELFRLYLPENRYYLYNWTRINCSTKLRDVLQHAIGTDFNVSKTIKPGATSFRAHEEPYLFNDLWMKFGTNILLGSPVDRPISPYDEAFMPDGLYGILKTLRVPGGQALVKKEVIVITARKTNEAITIVSPVLLFWLLFLLIIGLSFKTRAGRIIDLIVFTLCGLLGCFMLYLWFGSDHTETMYNWNLIWAFPTHFIFPALKGKARNYYSWLIIVLTIVMLSAWAFIPQELEPAVLAILMIQNTRSLFNLGIRKLINRVFNPVA